MHIKGYTEHCLIKFVIFFYWNQQFRYRAKSIIKNMFLKSLKKYFFTFYLETVSFESVLIWAPWTPLLNLKVFGHSNSIKK